jgi:hypothetical protein
VTPPIFTICAADTGVQTLLESAGRLRLFPFGEAGELETLPYATWQVVGGAPENYLGNVPDIDAISTQIDVFAKTASEARAAARAIRDAIEPFAHVTGWDGELRDAATRSYRVIFTAAWFVDRD